MLAWYNVIQMPLEQTWGSDGWAIWPQRQGSSSLVLSRPFSTPPSPVGCPESREPCNASTQPPLFLHPHHLWHGKSMSPEEIDLPLTKPTLALLQWFSDPARRRNVPEGEPSSQPSSAWSRRSRAPGLAVRSVAAVFPEGQAGRQWSSLLSPCGGRASAALAGLHHHVRQLLHFGGPPDIVQDGQGLQVLGYAARGGWGFRVQGVVQAQHLGREASLRGWENWASSRGPRDSTRSWGCSRVCVLSRSVVSDSETPKDSSLPRLLCPWSSPGNSTGVGWHSLLQGDLPDPGIKSGSPALPENSLPSEPPKWATDVISEDLAEPSLGEWQVAAHRERNIWHWSEHYWFKHDPHNQGTWNWSWNSLGWEETCLCWFLLAVTGHFGEELWGNMLHKLRPSLGFPWRERQASFRHRLPSLSSLPFVSCWLLLCVLHYLLK